MITIDPPSSPLALQELTTIGPVGLARFLTRARRAVELTGAVEVLLTSDAEIKRLNRAFRGKNKATDVLSFPAPEELRSGLAGDLAVSLDTAARQALEHGHSLAEEVRILLLHGLLHLAGEDHEVDDGEMAAREQALRRELKLPAGLIERVESAPSPRKSTTRVPVERKAAKKVATKNAPAKKVPTKKVPAKKVPAKGVAGRGAVGPAARLREERGALHSKGLQTKAATRRGEAR